MKKNSSKFLFCIALLTLIGFTLVGQELPPPPDPPKLVNDYANFLSAREEAILEQKLAAYDDSTSTQIVLITMPSLQGYPIDEFSYELGDAWGVGQKGKDNGMVITVAQKERKTFIATGWGIESYITDVQAKAIVDRIMIPSFRQGKFYDGLDRATEVIIGLLEGSFEAEQLTSKSEDHSFHKLVVLFVLLLIFVILIIAISKGNDDGSGTIGRRGWGGPVIWSGGGSSWGGSSSGGGFGGGGFGGFGGGSFGGGGAGGSW